MKKNLFGVSLLTITCLYGVLSAFVILIFILTGAPVIYGILISIIILILQFLISPIATDVSMRWFYKAKFNYDMPDYLKNFIGEVCKKYNRSTLFRMIQFFSIFSNEKFVPMAQQLT